MHDSLTIDKSMHLKLILLDKIKLIWWTHRNYLMVVHFQLKINWFCDKLILWLPPFHVKVKNQRMFKKLFSSHLEIEKWLETWSKLLSRNCEESAVFLPAILLPMTKIMSLGIRIVHEWSKVWLYYVDSKDPL